MIWKSLIFFCLFNSIISFAQINNKNNQADYLIISPEEFNQNLTPLVKLREVRGFAVKIVTLEEIYKTYVNLKPQFAIRQFVSDALQNWKEPKIKYVLLIGDTELLPAYHIKSMFSVNPAYKEDTVAIDDWYVTNQYENDKLPDAAIGRFPIKNDRQLNDIVSKIISFETELSRESFSEEAFFISDKRDAYFFEAETQKVNDKFTQAGFKTKRIDFNETSKFAGTKEQILDELRKGAIYNNYNGHGAPKVWSGYSILSIDDFDSSFQSNRPGIFTTLGCSQVFDNNDDSSLVEKLVLFPKGGAVATIAPAGIGMSNDGSRFISKFYDMILGDEKITIGEAIQKVKRGEISAMLPDDAICRRFTLLGDPALKTPPKTISAVTAGIKKPESIQLLQNYPNPFNASTIIRYQIVQTSTVSLKIYNEIGEMVNLLVDGEIQSPGYYEKSFDASHLASGIYFYSLSVDNSAYNKKMLLLK